MSKSCLQSQEIFWTSAFELNFYIFNPIIDRDSLILKIELAVSAVAQVWNIWFLFTTPKALITTVSSPTTFNVLLLRSKRN